MDQPLSNISNDSQTKNFYRPDIDGLRALAVLPVILFHANLFFPGGFIGVDVFFVISGYLITQIIERELKAGGFSVLVFYQRRMRRIFPALFVMLAVSTLFACLYLPPSELKDFGKLLISSSAFYSNILFSRRSSYFAPDSASPLCFIHGRCRSRSSSTSAGRCCSEPFVFRPRRNGRFPLRSPCLPALWR